LKKLVRRMKAYETRAIAIEARRKASGTARPTMPAGATPFKAMAAVGAMIPIEIANASQTRSSRRNTPWGRLADVVSAKSLIVIYLLRIWLPG
jgi:hypothetical protein